MRYARLGITASVQYSHATSDREQALASFTVNPAWLEGAEDRRGRLSPGYDADLVVLDGERVRATMVAGRWVHGRP